MPAADGSAHHVDAESIVRARGTTLATCPACEGSGSETGPRVPGWACQKCGGAGVVPARAAQKGDR